MIQDDSHFRPWDTGRPRQQPGWWHHLEGFEQEAQTALEDTKRLEAAWCVGLGMFHSDDPACAIPTITGLDEADMVDLIDVLESPCSHWQRGSLASSTHMRTIRQRVIQALFDAFDRYRDDELAAATVIKRTLHLTPEQLMMVSAAALKNQFHTDLNRAGVTAIPGPLVAFLHGEYDPTAGLFVIHWHLISTVEKAQALHGLKQRRGYTKTHTGAVPIRVDGLRDRVRQVSYLLKSFWGSTR